jgi:hypothetical protein
VSEPAPSVKDEAATPLTGGRRAFAYALVLVLTVQFALWGAFLVPFRVGATLVPVSWLIAVAGNVAVGLAGARLAGRIGAAIPALLWLGLAFTLGARRAEGDLIVVGSVTGLGFLVAGALTSAVMYGLAAGSQTARR